MSEGENEMGLMRFEPLTHEQEMMLDLLEGLPRDIQMRMVRAVCDIINEWLAEDDPDLSNGLDEG